MSARDLIRAVRSALRIPGRRTSSERQREIFTGLYHQNAWGDPESVSGPGSTIARGNDFRDSLIKVFREFEIRSILDAPCGDFNWMRTVLADHDATYIGVDIVEELVQRNEQLHGSESRRFLHLDLTRDDLPRADLVLCRDALVHFSFGDIDAAIGNIRRSGSRYLLATTFVGDRRNQNIRTGGWRPLNMQRPPFSFPEPLALIDEQCAHSGGIYRDKHLGLWKV